MINGGILILKSSHHGKVFIHHIEGGIDVGVSANGSPKEGVVVWIKRINLVYFRTS